VIKFYSIERDGNILIVMRLCEEAQEKFHGITRGVVVLGLKIALNAKPSRFHAKNPVDPRTAVTTIKPDRHETPQKTRNFTRDVFELFPAVRGNFFELQHRCCKIHGRSPQPRV
jgi:hypothetical protein